MSNSNRFTITSPNYSVTATTAGGLQASFGQEVFIPSTWAEAESLMSQSGDVNLLGKTYVRENGGSWDSYTIAGNRTISNGTLTGMIKLASNGNVWANQGNGLWSIPTDNLSGGFIWKDYNNVNRTDVTLNESIDTGRSTAHLIEPERSLYDGQPAISVWPPPPAEYVRYPTCLNGAWLPFRSTNLNEYNGTVQTDSGNKIIGLTVESVSMKAQIRAMVSSLTGAAAGNPERLTILMRSASNDIDDSNVQTWDDGNGGSDPIVITFNRDTFNMTYAPGGYCEICFTGDRSYIQEPGGWVIERTDYVDTMTTQQTAESTKTIFYQPAYSDNPPDAYYPVAPRLLKTENNPVGNLTFDNVIFIGACQPVKNSGVGYLINHANSYNYNFTTDSHDTNDYWTVLTNCKIGYSWFGLRGKLKMYDCFATDVVRNTTALADGTEVLRNVFSAAYTFETVVVLANTSGGSAANVPCRRSVVKDNIFYQEPTCHGQGLSFYNDANLNFECRHNLFLNCQRSWSMQPDSPLFWRNAGVVAPGATQEVVNNLSIFDNTSDKTVVPAQSTFASNGGSDFWYSSRPRMFFEHNTLLLRPGMSSEFPEFADDSPLNPRYMIDLGDVGYSQASVRNNLYGSFRTRGYPPEDDFGTVATVADLANLASPTKGDTYFITSELATDYPTRTYNDDGQWIRMAGQQDVADPAARDALVDVDDLHVVYVESEDQCYQWRDPIWVAIDNPYQDQSLVPRNGVYLAGNLRCMNEGDGLSSVLDIGNEGDYMNDPSDYSMIVYEDDQEITPTAAFNGAGDQGLTPGVLWTNIPTPEDIRSWIAVNFNPVTAPDSRVWYSVYPEDAAFDSTVVTSRLSSAAWAQKQTNTPLAFLSKSSADYDTRPIS